ncbi:hypothetical protein GCM10022261_23810 [Brevibacterium daeguense]|uniref:Integral membrane protein n=1 Tax=Brevibacterium daeguense TaxID=909936 RepID=A0ABP8ELV3_9MICO
MFTALTIVFYVYCAVLTIWALVLTFRNTPAGKGVLGATAGLLVLLLVQLVVSIVMWGQSRDTDPLLFFGYLFTALVLVPLAGFWAYAELSRWGPAVLAAAGVTVFVMIERMDQIWL